MSNHPAPIADYCSYQDTQGQRSLHRNPALRLGTWGARSIGAQKLALHVQRDQNLRAIIGQLCAQRGRARRRLQAEAAHSGCDHKS